MPDRSNLEDKAMAVGLVALGAALPLYEQFSERLRDFHASTPGRVLGATARTAIALGRVAQQGVQRFRSGEETTGELPQVERAEDAA